MTDRILLDLTPLVTVSTLRGIGRYVRGLVKGLALLDRESGPHVQGVVADYRLAGLRVVDDLESVCSAPARKPVLAANIRRTLLLNLRLPGIVRRSGALAHVTDPEGMPWSKTLPYVVTCHDLIPLVLSDLYLPRVRGWRRGFRLLKRVRYRQPRAILAVSHATRRDLCEQLGLDEAGISVVWHGVDHDRFHPRAAAGEADAIARLLGSSAPYILYMGAGDVRKDLDTLLIAYSKSKLRGQVQLVIAGELRERKPALARLGAELGLGDDLKLLGYVDEELLPALYRTALVHVFPSRYEGFGLPVLEAMACGAPTITSPGSSLDEVAGDAAWIVPCGQVDDMLHALERLAEDAGARADLRQKGLVRAASFTWEATARGTREFWRQHELLA